MDPIHTKRLGAVVTLTLAAALFAGCDSGGVTVGQAPDAATAAPQPDALKAQMQANAKNMQLKGQGPPKKAAR
jgi:hypothetical protein